MNKFIANNIDPKRIKNKVIIDSIVKYLFLGITLICASVIIIIVLFIFIRGISPFINNYNIKGVDYKVNLAGFMFGTTWHIPPNIYGVGFIVVNTLYIVFLSLLIAVPISILTALFIGKIAPKRIASGLSYVIDILASIPSIIFGLFGVGFINPFVKWIAGLFNFQSAGGISTLSTVLVLSFMIIPTVTMLSLTSIRAVKRDVINGSLALGASKTQTNFKVILTSAKSGVFSGIILGVGRALGEATAVSLVAGNRGTGPTFNLFDTTRTLTSTMLMGFKETTGLDYDIRFSVGVVLIFVILVTNLILNAVKRRLGSIK